MSAARIFVSIAAYREFDLVPTLRSLIAGAEEPDSLRICLCWQRAPDESLAELADDSRLEVIDVPYGESLGVCWARSEIQKRYAGEEWALQLDGHHRFAVGWDRRLIERLEALLRGGCPKPVLTTYAPAFDPRDDPAKRSTQAWATAFDRFDPAGVVFLKPVVVPPETAAPVPTRFWSAHFSFSPGSFVEDVPYDPELYFHSEEISICVRGWTAGYDYFAPDETLVWHEYSRAGRVCHWDDHADWGESNLRSLQRYRSLLGVDGVPRVDLGRYGLGRLRTLDAWQRYAGICFASRGVQPSTLENRPPPGSESELPEESWGRSLRSSHSLEITVPRERLVGGDHDFWAIFANADDGEELYRREIDRRQIAALLAEQRGDRLWFLLDVLGRRRPRTWTLWPHHPERGWDERIDGDWPCFQEKGSG